MHCFYPAAAAETAYDQHESSCQLMHLHLLCFAAQAMKFLQQAVGLRGYAQRDPLAEYKLEGYQLFLEMMAAIRRNTVRAWPLCAGDFSSVMRALLVFRDVAYYSEGRKYRVGHVVCLHPPLLHAHLLAFALTIGPGAQIYNVYVFKLQLRPVDPGSNGQGPAEGAGGKAFGEKAADAAKEPAGARA